jgi:uncharacterized membrane protein YhhN
VNVFFRWFGLPGRFVLTCLMSLLALILAAAMPAWDRWLRFAAMLLSSLGDIVLMDFRNIGEKLPLPGFAVGAALFMLAHFVYIAAFALLLSAAGIPWLGGGFVFGALLAAAALVGVTWGILRRGKGFDWPMYGLCAAYLLAVGANLATICAYGFGRGGWALPAALGAVSFFCSDLLIGLDKLLDFRLPHHVEVIWWLYPIGQILILTAA